MHRWMTCGAAIGVDFAPHLLELSSIIRVPNVKQLNGHVAVDCCWEGSNNSITSQHCFGGGVTLCQQDIKHTAQHAEAPFPRHAAKLQPQGQYIQVSWIIYLDGSLWNFIMTKLSFRRVCWTGVLLRWFGTYFFRQVFFPLKSWAYNLQKPYSYISSLYHLYPLGMKTSYIFLD